MEENAVTAQKEKRARSPKQRDEDEGYATPKKPKTGPAKTQRACGKMLGNAGYGNHVKSCKECQAKDAQDMPPPAQIDAANNANIIQQLQKHSHDMKTQINHLIEQIKVLPKLLEQQEKIERKLDGLIQQQQEEQQQRQNHHQQLKQMQQQQQQQHLLQQSQWNKPPHISAHNQAHSINESKHAKPKSREADPETGVIIAGVPQQRNEDTGSIVQAIAKHIGMNITSNNFQSFRLPSNYKDKAPRIIVKFDSRLLKISFRKGCKEKRVTIQDMNVHLDQEIDSNASIYVNEHLTREQSVIFYHVRQFKAQRN
jgi:hypothetical protein